MGKTFRKDGSNRNKHFVKSRRNNTRKPNKNDYQDMLNEHEEDSEYVERK